MWGMKTVRIAENQRAIWMQDGDFKGVLMPGKYRFYKRAAQTEVSIYASNKVELVEPQMAHLVKQHREALMPHAELVELGEHEVGLLRLDGVAVQLLRPGAVAAFWSHVHRVSVERLDIIRDAQVPEAWLHAMRLAGDRLSTLNERKLLQHLSLDKGEEAILLVDGEVDSILGPGRYGFWHNGQEIRGVVVDKRVQTMEINGQEILTKDRVSLRVNAVLQYLIVDVVKAKVDIQSVETLAYQAMQFALRRAVGAITLDELLANKAALSIDVQADVASQIAQLGLTAEVVGVKDVILPGEMKDILNQVVQAEKQAEANAVRRRDESANVRALANTARMLEGNPMMVRLKELETLENITAKVDSLHVMNGLDGVLNKLITVQSS